MESIDRTAADILTVGAAAARYGLNERTLRRWIASGKLPSRPDAGGGRGRLIDAAELEARLGALRGNGHGPDGDRTPDRTDSGQRPDSDRTVTGQRTRHADIDRSVELVRMAERLAAAERERDRLAADLEFTRAQIQEARRSEEQLRVLLLEQARALQGLTALGALAPATVPPRRRWWAWWR